MNTSTTHQDITDHANHIAKRNTYETRITRDGDDTWAEFAAEVNEGGCPDCPTQTNGPHFDLIEGGRIVGGIGGQCGGCGSMGHGWETSGAKLVESEDDLDQLASTFRAHVVAVAEQYRADEQTRVNALLAEATEWLRAGNDLADFHAVGSENDPGVFIEVGQLVAWSDNAPGEIVEAVGEVPA